MIFIDIETVDFFQDAHIKALPRHAQLQAIRFGIAVTYDDVTDEWREWNQHELMELHDYLVNQDICGWNIRDFDLPVIHYNLANHHDYPSAELDPLGNVIDLFADIKQATGRWYKLGLIAEANLGRGKIAHGQQATEWLRSGDPALMLKAAEYCRDDVQLVMELYAILARGEALRLPPRVEREETEELRFELAAAQEPSQ